MLKFVVYFVFKVNFLGLFEAFCFNPLNIESILPFILFLLTWNFFLIIKFPHFFFIVNKEAQLFLTLKKIQENDCLFRYYALEAFLKFWNFFS